MHMNDKLYHSHEQENSDQRVRSVAQEVCSKKSTPPPNSLQAKGARYFCQRMQARHKRRQRITQRIEGKEYTFKRWLTGNHSHHTGPPGLALGLMSMAQTGFGYWGQRVAMQDAYAQDSHLTQVAIYNHNFRATNCIGQESIFDFKWKFLNSQGDPLSIDGLPVRSDLSNWDMQSAGNFTQCNRKHFFSPFTLNPNYQDSQGSI